jgi:coenzyme PQQ synthesis protein D (PqqD)
MSESIDRLTFASDVIFQVIEGEALLLKLHQEVVFSLNETGTRIAQLIAEGRSLPHIIEAIGREYDKRQDEVAPAVTALVAALIDKGLVTHIAGSKR